MLNQCLFTGTVASKRKYKDICKIKLEVNNNVLSESNTIPVELWEDVPGVVVESINVGDTIGVKGRIKMCDGKITIVVEKVTPINNVRG